MNCNPWINFRLIHSSSGFHHHAGRSHSSPTSYCFVYCNIFHSDYFHDLSSLLLIQRMVDKGREWWTGRGRTTKYSILHNLYSSCFTISSLFSGSAHFSLDFGSISSQSFLRERIYGFSFHCVNFFFSHLSLRWILYYSISGTNGKWYWAGNRSFDAWKRIRNL